eukprot:TRINITY_DN5821_c0_g1_i1.p1 TRINITY_DN5821_c0_g1~~TRINITY_DN5821_c0_g1_i1.p1  ORF type:complete len:557 (+),score=90.91 TRINITY_DN5821_c0_g1_i1:602-2272(+)
MELIFPAYVQQDDSLSGVLTVYETLWYSALLKLPYDSSMEEKNERVLELIEELGLKKVMHTKIGNWAYRGVSGGERRRVSIGVELITKPTLLLMDEPTSGLDSMSARMLVELSKALCAPKGSGVLRTVVMTLHQPSSYVFSLFDSFYLLSEGNQIWQGSYTSALKYFAAIKLKVPPHTNPADWYLESVNISFRENRSEGLEFLSQLNKQFTESKYYKNLTTTVDNINKSGAGFQSPTRDGGFIEKTCTHNYKYNTPNWWQTLVLCKRFFVCWLRDPGVFWARFIMYFMISFMMGTEYLRQSNNQSTIQDRISILFFSAAFLIFMSVAAVPAFIEERYIFIRERANAYYSVGPYTLASSLVCMPFVFMIALSFTGFSYFLMNMHSTPEAFFYFLLDLFIALLTAEAIISSIAAVSPSYIVGIAVGAGMYGMYMINQGFFIRADHIPGWWIWVHYIVVHKYSFEGFMVNEFMGSVFSCQNATQVVYDPIFNTTFNSTGCHCYYADLNNNCQTEGVEVLTEYGYQDVNKWAWLGVMLGMVIIYRFIFYSFLLLFNRGKR